MIVVNLLELLDLQLWSPSPSLEHLDIRVAQGLEISLSPNGVILMSSAICQHFPVGVFSRAQNLFDGQLWFDATHQLVSKKRIQSFFPYRSDRSYSMPVSKFSFWPLLYVLFKVVSLLSRVWQLSSGCVPPPSQIQGGGGL